MTCTEVLVQFRRPPAVYSPTPPPPNYLRFRISPDVEIALGVMIKVPGEEMAGTGDRAAGVPALRSRDEMDAYERLLGDAMKGDATLFAREDYVEEAWRIVDPVLKADTPVYALRAENLGAAGGRRESLARGRVEKPGRDGVIGVGGCRKIR